jgi:ribosome maturation factor RimP
VDSIFVDGIVGRIGRFLGPLLDPDRLFIVDITMRGHRGNMVLEVYIDGDEGVTTAACAGVSRALSKELDDAVLKGEAYTLTVSSPGLDRPLKFPRQFPKHVGREIHLDVRTDEGHARIGGTLTAAGEEAVEVKEKGREIPTRVPHAEILEARIVPRW